MMTEDQLLGHYERVADEALELLANADTLSQKALRDRTQILALTVELLAIAEEVRRRIQAYSNIEPLPAKYPTPKRKGKI